LAEFFAKTDYTKIDIENRHHKLRSKVAVL
jgi:hypothetical protein